MKNALTSSQANDAPLLRIERLTFGYEHRQLFDRLSVTFRSGFHWIKGGNGSGKSTFLQLVGGGLNAASGSVELLGVRQDSDPLAVRRQIFWCGPGPVAFDHLSALEYFGFIRGLYPTFDTAALERHIAGFRLEPHKAKLLRSLSTGTQRKVWLAAALAVGTPVVLLDEPLNALDQASLRYLETTLASEDSGSAARRIWLIASHEPFGSAAETATHFDLELGQNHLQEGNT